MGILFDPVAKRAVLDTSSVSAAELWSRWIDWFSVGDNAKYLPAFRTVGGDELSGGLLIPPYVFLINGWRVRPMEQDHDLVITGNLFVDGGGTPVVRTLGPFQVNVNYTVPVQAQGISTSGSSGPTASAIAEAVRAELAADLARVLTLEKLLRNKQVTDPVSGTITVFEEDGSTVFAQADLFEDASGNQPYRGQGAERRERLE